MKKYTRKFKYWHSIIDASKTQKKELTKNGSKLQHLMIDLSYAHKPEGRVIFTNLITGEESWIDVKYLGRLPINATIEEKIKLGKGVSQ